MIFLDADDRLPTGDFFKRFLAEFEKRHLDVACPLYVPYRSTRAVERFHTLLNFVIKAFQRILPSGSGMCIAVRVADSTPPLSSTT